MPRVEPPMASQRPSDDLRGLPAHRATVPLTSSYKNRVLACQRLYLACVVVHESRGGDTGVGA
jgi:hypothetical protein